MPESYDEPLELEYRRTVESQLASFRATAQEAGTDLAWDSPEAADHRYLYVPGKLLVRQDRDGDFQEIFARRSEFPPEPADPADPNRLRRDEDRTFPGDLVSYTLPRFTESADQDVRVTLRVLDEEMGEGFGPEHYVHVAVLGGGKSCPATEPEETGQRGPWPPARPTQVPPVGTGVIVTLVDTGWVGNGDPPTAELTAGQDLSAMPLAEYDGHGMFAEAVVRAQAPGAEIRRVEFAMSGGAVPEGDLADALGRAIDVALEETPAGEAERPHIISMSAGCHTYNDQPLPAFEDLWTAKLSKLKNTVLIAAAGNDSSPREFYPAASPWATGVGALDRDGEVSSFSNYRRCADVFLLGRNHINRFPHGRYSCAWVPDLGDVREFRTGWARWSGTSFSTPLLSGLLAAYVGDEVASGTSRRVVELVDDYLTQNALWRYRPVYGDHRAIPRTVFSPA